MHEYVASAPVTTLLEPPVPVVHVMQVPCVQGIKKIVETPGVLSGQVSQISTSLGTAPVRHVNFAEIVGML